MHTKTKGKIAEMMVSAKLMALGWKVLLPFGENSRYDLVAEKVSNWGKDTISEYGYSAVGGVVGATYPLEAKKLRKTLKNSYLLVPGYGSQGGKAEDMVNFFNEDGLGAIVNASRSILCAYRSELWKDKYSEKEYYMASRNEAVKMRDDINKALGI